MFDPNLATWTEKVVNFELKISNQMEKKTKQRWGKDGVGVKIKTI